MTITGDTEIKIDTRELDVQFDGNTVTVRKK